MKKKRIIIASIFAFVANQSLAQTITIYCPTKIDFTPESKTYANYIYTAYTSVDLPVLGNQIELTGEGNASPAVTPTLQDADWTDRTFLCGYSSKTADGSHEDMVMYETVLDNYVSTCHFPGNASGCYTNNNPQDCPLTCELEENKNFKK